MSRIPNFPTIGGALPFAQQAGVAAQFQGLGGSPEQTKTQLGTNYANAYNSALSMNQALYENINKGYQDILSGQQNAADTIQGGYADAYGRLTAAHGQVGEGYTGLTNQVMSGIEGIGRTRAQDINAGYLRDYAGEQQRLISAGLGNSTVLGSVGRALTTDRERALNENAERVAGLRAGYQAQLGQAGLGFRERASVAAANQAGLGLGYQERAAREAAGIGQNQLGWMNTVQAPFPDAGMYASILSQAGAAQQAGADRGLIQQQGVDQRRIADQAGGPAMQATVPTFGGGAARGVGGLSAPEANYGGNPQYALQGAGGFLGAGAFAPQSQDFYGGQALGGYTDGETYIAPYEDLGSYNDALGGVGGGLAAAAFGAGYPSGDSGGGGFGDYLGGMFGY